MKKIQKIVGVLIVSSILEFAGCTVAEDSKISEISLISSEETLPTEVTESVADETEGGIYVHICGEVLVPGVYAMPGDSRLVDVVNAAGGLTQEADADRVNMAGKLVDGEQVLIPSIKETGNVQEKVSSKAEDGRLDINHADAAELCTLSGIGESRAQAIIRYREEHGAFERIEDIMKVTGIKQGLFQKIKEKICVR